MGMFDELKCNYKLPSDKFIKGQVFQTKAFNCGFDNYLITKKGNLKQLDHQWNVFSEEKVFYTGDIIFYNFDPTNEKELIYFKADFYKGKLTQSIELIERE